MSIPALKGIDLEVKKGEFLAIAGVSGSGKSTMMNLIGCLDLPSKGKIFLDGDDIADFDESKLAQIRGQKIGFVFQQFNLIPTLTALENVMRPLEFQDVDTSRARKKALEILNLVGLGDRVHHLPSQLSGGQQQRVAISRALSVDPEIILADEPTGNLDSKTGEFIMDFLNKIHQKDSKKLVCIAPSSSAGTDANIVITGVKPTELSPGDTKAITLTVKNGGSNDARQITFNFQESQHNYAN
ncbi:MAG: ABC transporter ATP-binding protein [Euryarchaeota archaeon]|nr:ABC transporter ATP-binding protein [Euryarchaeota archaeon]